MKTNWQGSKKLKRKVFFTLVSTYLYLVHPYFIDAYLDMAAIST